MRHRHHLRTEVDERCQRAIDYLARGCEHLVPSRSPPLGVAARALKASGALGGRCLARGGTEVFSRTGGYRYLGISCRLPVAGAHRLAPGVAPHRTYLHTPPFQSPTLRPMRKTPVSRGGPPFHSPTNLVSRLPVAPNPKPDSRCSVRRTRRHSYCQQNPPGSSTPDSA